MDRACIQPVLKTPKVPSAADRLLKQTTKGRRVRAYAGSGFAVPLRAQTS